jgi:hypothetical protein
MKKSDEYKESKQAAYVQSMARSLKEIKREIKPASTIQCASTQESLDTSDEQYAAKVKKMFEDKSWKAPHPDTVARNIDPFEFNLIEDTRRKPKNSIGQSDKSSVNDERKELGRQAYISTPPSPLREEEKERLIELDKIKQLDTMPKEEWRPLTDWQAFKHWIIGGKIKPEEKK